MSIKTNELQQLQSILGTDSLLADTAAAGTGRLTLAKAAEFFGAELIKPGNPVSTALSNKAAKSAQNTVEATSVPSRTVEVAAADLPGYIAGLPRLLTEDLRINTTGTLTGTLEIKGFYGSGSISINGHPTVGEAQYNMFEVQGSVYIANCLVELTICGMTVRQTASSGTYLVLISGGGPITFGALNVVGLDKTRIGLSSYGSPNIIINGLQASNLDLVANCGCGIMAIESGADYCTDNTRGIMVWRGGIAILSPDTPSTLGGSSNTNNYGAVIKNSAFV